VGQLKKHLGSKVVPTPGLPLIDDKWTIKVAPEAILEPGSQEQCIGAPMAYIVAEHATITGYLGRCVLHSQGVPIFPSAASSVSSVIYKVILLCQVSSHAVHFSLNGRRCFTFPFITLLLPLCN
jgi:hypothetical protein